MYTKCIKQLQKRCMIHEKQTIQKKNNMRENAGIQFEQEQQQPNDHNHKTDFITVFNDENICEFVYTQKDFPALFWVRCRLTVASNVHSLQLLIWNDLPKGEIEERKRNVVLFTSLEMNWMFVRFSQRHLFAIHYWFSNINMMANFPLHPFLLPVQSIFDHIPKNHQINSFEL